jgi:hypothetical protein
VKLKMQWRFKEVRVAKNVLSAKESCSQWIEPTQERGHVGCNCQSHYVELPKPTGAHAMPPRALGARLGATWFNVFPTGCPHASFLHPHSFLLAWEFYSVPLYLESM